MRNIGEGFAFAALVAAATALELNGAKASGLWVFIVLWVMFTDWGANSSKSDS